MCTASKPATEHRIDAHHVDSLFVELVAGEGGLGKGVPQASKPTPMPGSSAGSRRDLPCQLLLTRAQIAPRAVLDLCGASLISRGRLTVRECSAYGCTPCTALSAPVCSASSASKPSARYKRRRRRASEMSQDELSVTRDVSTPCATSHTVPAPRTPPGPRRKF